MTWALPPLSREMTHCWKEPAGAAGSGDVASAATGSVAAYAGEGTQVTAVAAGR